MSKKPRRYEKVDKHVIRLITEEAQNIPITELIETRRKIVSDRDRAIKVIVNIDEILAKAKALGITPESKDKNILKEGRGQKPNTQKPSDAFRKPEKPKQDV